MQIWEIVLIGGALAMDAVAVGMTDGMVEPKMPLWKVLLVAGAFALFQFLMPLIGYYFGAVFTVLVAKIAPWLSFALLVFIGGKMIFDCVREMREKKRELSCRAKDREKLGAGKLLLQAVATSLDALAVGVTLLAAETAEGLPFHVSLCALVIGGVTLLFSFPAVLIGKKAGDKFADKAEIVGGIVLIFIGVKILIEAFL